MKSILSITALFLSLSINVFSQVVNCSRCNGTGKETKQSPYECQNCKSWNSEYRRQVPCHVCRNTRVNPNRKTWTETCSRCKGTGRDYAQEARNKDFGGKDFRVVNGAYSGQISNMEFKSLSIEYREAYKAGVFGNGIKTEFEYKEWATACSCMGTNWRLSSKDELESISGYLKVNGELNVAGIGYYGSSTETTVNGSPRVWVQYLSNDFVNSPIRETPGSSNIKTAKIFCVKYQVSNTISDAQVNSAKEFFGVTNSSNNNSSSYGGYVGQPTGCISGDCQNGFGTYTWSNGSMYRGNFLNGAMNGIGEHFWIIGTRYKGEYLNNKRTGMGEFYWTDGGYYIGQFVDGKLTGTGKLVSGSGVVTEGYFENGVLIRKQ